MTTDLVVHCPTDGCRFQQEPIRLLISNPEQTKTNPNLWPSDGTWLYLACPECKRVSAYCYTQIAGFPDDQDDFQTDTAWLRISFRCAEEGCNTPAELHVQIDTIQTQRTRPRLLDRLRTGYWSGTLQCGHPIAITSDQDPVLERALGTMQGYNPGHPRWKRI